MVTTPSAALRAVTGWAAMPVLGAELGALPGSCFCRHWCRSRDLSVARQIWQRSMVPLKNSGQEQCSCWTTAFSQSIVFEHAGLWLLRIPRASRCCHQSDFPASNRCISKALQFSFHFRKA